MRETRRHHSIQVALSVNPATQRHKEHVGRRGLGRDRGSICLDMDMGL